MTLLLLLACAGCRDAAGDAPTSVLPAPPPPRAAEPTAALPLSSLLGINEGISTPQRTEAGTSREQLLRALADDAARVASVGATVTRGHTVAFPRLSYDRWLREGRDWWRADAWVQAGQAAGLDLVGMVGPFPGNRTREATSVYAVQDVAGYQAFVAAAAERYDGDGVDDMPGLTRPLLAWEIDNEPDLKNRADPRSPTGDDFATPAQFAEVIRLTASAIRQASPGTLVVGGSFGSVTNPSGHAYMEALFDQPGVLEALDVVSVHAYHEGPGTEVVELALDRVRGAAPGKRVWLTETSVPSVPGRKAAAATEASQAEILVRTYGVALAAGVERVFWHTLADPPPGPHPPTAITANSLFRTDAAGTVVRKPAGDAYLRLSQAFAGGTRSAVREEAAEGGRVVRLGDGRWLAWGAGPVTAAVEATRATRVVDGARVELRPGQGGVTVPCGEGAVLLER